MVVSELDPLDTLVFRLVSKTANASLKNKDGSYFSAAKIAKPRYNSPRAKKNEPEWLNCCKVMRTIERGWHRDSLASAFCTHCTDVLPRSDFPDPELSPSKLDRCCLTCGFTGWTGRKLNWIWNSVEVDGVLHNYCGICR